MVYLKLALFVLSTVSNALESPGSLPSGFSLWLDSSYSSSLTLSGTSVTSWADQSGLFSIACLKKEGGNREIIFLERKRREVSFEENNVSLEVNDKRKI